MAEINNPVSDLGQLKTKDHDQLDGLTDHDHTQYAILIGTNGNKPVSSEEGSLFWERDTGDIFRFSSSSWSNIGTANSLEDAISKAQSILDLEDTPNSLSGSAGQALLVNSGESGYEHGAVGSWKQEATNSFSTSTAKQQTTGLPGDTFWMIEIELEDQSGANNRPEIRLNDDGGQNYDAVSGDGSLYNNRNGFQPVIFDSNAAYIGRIFIDPTLRSGYHSLFGEQSVNTVPDLGTSLGRGVHADNANATSFELVLDASTTGNYTIYSWQQ